MEKRPPEENKSDERVRGNNDERIRKSKGTLKKLVFWGCVKREVIPFPLCVGEFKGRRETGDGRQGKAKDGTAFYREEREGRQKHLRDFLVVPAWRGLFRGVSGDSYRDDCRTTVETRHALSKEQHCGKSVPCCFATRDNTIPLLHP